MKNKLSLYIIGILVIIVIASHFMLRNNENNITGNTTATTSNESIQKIVIGMKNYNYYPNVIKVKSGIPVSISLDKSVDGCFRDLTIRKLGIHKYLRTSKDTIEFIPAKAGEYTFACSMGMGTGKLIVE
ncbi:cupredoxin domain-containing protein [Candidatus Woesearchaeota archaeon]|nr:cupredoxin domain-containing protein [Candidatus Woesearchaeota archaeon]